MHVICLIEAATVGFFGFQKFNLILLGVEYILSNLSPVRWLDNSQTTSFKFAYELRLPTIRHGLRESIILFHL